MTPQQEAEGDRRELVGAKDEVVMGAGDDRVNPRDVQGGEQDADEDEVDLLAGVEAPGRWYRRSREQARGCRYQPLAVLHIETAQLARRAAQRPPVPRHDDQCHATDEQPGRREVPGIHHVVKSPAAADDEAAEEQTEESLRRETMDGSLRHGEALKP